MSRIQNVDRVLIGISVALMFAPGFLWNGQLISYELFRTMSNPIPLWLIIWGVRNMAARSFVLVSAPPLMVLVGITSLLSVWANWTWWSDVAITALMASIIVSIIHARAKLLKAAYGQESVYLLGVSLPLWLSTVFRFLNLKMWKAKHQGLRFIWFLGESKEIQIPVGEPLLGAQYLTVMAKGKLDLSAAAFHSATININVIMGGLQLEIPIGCDMKLEATRFFGTVVDRRDIPKGNSPRTSPQGIYLTGLILFGRLVIVNSSKTKAVKVSQTEAEADDVTDMIEVTTVTNWASEFYAIYFTPKRMIIVRTGYINVLAMDFVTYQATSRLAESRAATLRHRSPETILSSELPATEIMYRDVRSIKLQRKAGWNIVISTNTKDYTFNLDHEFQYRDISTIFSDMLDEKVKMDYE